MKHKDSRGKNRKAEASKAEARDGDMTDTAQNNRRIAKNTFYLYLRMGITMLVQLYTSRIVLQALGIEDYGIYNIVGSVVVMFSFISGPLGTATQRFYNFELGKKDGGNLNTIFNISLYCFLILALVMFLLVELGGVWYISNKMNLPPDRTGAAMFVFQFSLLTFLLSLVKTPFESLIIAHENMSYYAYVSILDVVLKLLNAFSLTWFLGDKLKLYAVNHLVIALIIFMCVQFYCHRRFTAIRIAKVWDSGIFKSMASFSGWSLFGSVASMSANQGLNLLLNFFYGVTVNAAVGVANQVSAAVNQFVGNFQIAFRPQIVKYYSGEELDALRALVHNTAKYSYFLLFALACPVMFNAQFLLEIWLGKVPEFASAFVVLNLIYLLLETLSAPMWMTIQATGKIRNYQIVISSVIFLNIIISYFFLKAGYSPTVVMEIKCCLDLAYLAIRLLFMRAKIQFSIREFARKVLLPVSLVTALSVIPTAILSYLDLEGWKYLIASVLTFMVFYMTSVFFIGIGRSERERVLVLLKRKQIVS